jgi:hypothetical protein
LQNSLLISLLAGEFSHPRPVGIALRRQPNSMVCAGRVAALKIPATSPRLSQELRGLDGEKRWNARHDRPSFRGSLWPPVSDFQPETAETRFEFARDRFAIELITRSPSEVALSCRKAAPIPPLDGRHSGGIVTMICALHQALRRDRERRVDLAFQSRHHPYQQRVSVLLIAP